MTEKGGSPRGRIERVVLASLMGDDHVRVRLVEAAIAAKGR